MKKKLTPNRATCETPLAEVQETRHPQLGVQPQSVAWYKGLSHQDVAAKITGRLIGQVEKVIEEIPDFSAPMKKTKKPRR